MDVNGVMYEIRVPSKDLSMVEDGKEMVIYIRESVRDGEPVELIGFLSEEGQMLYDALRNVSGIGPRNALKIIDFIDLNTLSIAVRSKDVKLLSSLPGIGTKMAERIIIELTGKVKPVQSSAKFGEAVETLIALGFSRQEAFEAVKKSIENGADNLESIIKGALSSTKKV